MAEPFAEVAAEWGKWWEAKHAAQPITSEGLVVRLSASSVTPQSAQVYPDGPLFVPFIFQCPPLESFGVGFSYAHVDYQTVGGETVSRPGARGLRTISFDTLFVDDDVFYDAGRQVVSPSWIVSPTGGTDGHAAEMKQRLDRLVEVCETGVPFRLKIGHSMPQVDVGADVVSEVNMTATLRDVKIEERHGEGDTRYVSASFMEYRQPVTKARKKGAAHKPHHAKTPATHKVTAKDTLHSLSLHYYGDATGYWKGIVSANKAKFPKNFSHPSTKLVSLSHIKVGTSLHIPTGYTVEITGHSSGGLAS